MFKYNQTISDEEYAEFKKFMDEYNRRKQEKRKDDLLYRVLNVFSNQDKK